MTRLLKNVIFTVCTVLLFFIGVELLLRAIHFRFCIAYLEENIFEPLPSGLVRTAPHLTQTKPYGFAFAVAQEFPRAKPAGTLRVVMVGGSNVVRFQDCCQEKLVRRLEEKLGQKVEFINMGFQGCGSNRVLRSAEEAMNYQPDVLLVYDGHNEFISYCDPETKVTIDGKVCKRPSAVQTWLYQHVRLIQLMNKIAAFSQTPTKAKITRWGRFYTPEDKAKIYGGFENHLESLLALAQKHSCRVVLATLAYDAMVPPLTESTITPNARAIEQMSEADLKRALALPGWNALHEYYLGIRAFERGDIPTARQLIDRSFIDSVRPYRAPKTINEIIVRVAQKTHTPYADIAKAIEDRAWRGPGYYTLFVDHVHFTPEGNTLMLNEFCKVIEQMYGRE